MNFSSNPAPSALDSRSASIPENEFTAAERSTLLQLAHESILSALEQREISLDPPTPHLSEQRGVFTSLYLGDALRGCVGYVLPLNSLYRAVAGTARAAAFNDTRFSPITIPEASHLKIELSIPPCPSQFLPKPL